jgi:alpha-L-fucosidase
VSRYNVVDATPFKRDILKELAAACAKRNMRLGFYYSQAQDWHEPNGAGNSWDFPPNDKKDFDQYLRDKAEPQVRELLTGYGPVALIWFDTPQLMTAERAKRFTDIVRSLQPNTLIDGRLGAEGDYISTGDNIIPGEKRTEAWETPATINHTWGYRKDDVDWKRPGEIVFKLVDIVSKGGNYLLNVGPMADGIIPQASQDVLRAAGRWLKVNGEAVYGAMPTPFGEELGEPSAKGTKDLRGQPLFLVRDEYRVTAKPGKLYITFFVEPRVPFELPAMKNVKYSVPGFAVTRYSSRTRNSGCPRRSFVPFALGAPSSSPNGVGIAPYTASPFTFSQRPAARSTSWLAGGITPSAIGPTFSR